MVEFTSPLVVQATIVVTVAAMMTVLVTGRHLTDVLVTWKHGPILG